MSSALSQIPPGIHQAMVVEPLLGVSTIRMEICYGKTVKSENDVETISAKCLLMRKS